jgi:hypothetical protein
VTSADVIVGTRTVVVDQFDIGVVFGPVIAHVHHAHPPLWTLPVGSSMEETPAI